MLRPRRTFCGAARCINSISGDTGGGFSGPLPLVILLAAEGPRTVAETIPPAADAHERIANSEFAASVWTFDEVVQSAQPGLLLTFRHRSDVLAGQSAFARFEDDGLGGPALTRNQPQPEQSHGGTRRPIHPAFPAQVSGTRASRREQDSDQHVPARLYDEHERG